MSFFSPAFFAASYRITTTPKARSKGRRRHIFQKRKCKRISEGSPGYRQGYNKLLIVAESPRGRSLRMRIEQRKLLGARIPGERERKPKRPRQRNGRMRENRRATASTCLAAREEPRGATSMRIIKRCDNEQADTRERRRRMVRCHRITR